MGAFYGGGLFPDLLVCGLCGPPLLTKLAIKSETLLSTRKKKEKKTFQAAQKRKPVFLGLISLLRVFGFSKEAFFYLKAALFFASVCICQRQKQESSNS